MSHNVTQHVYFLPGGLTYERGGDASRTFCIKPLKETNLGVGWPFLTPERDHFVTTVFSYWCYRRLWLHEFRFPGNGFGFLVSRSWIPDSLSWITDSKAEGSGFLKQNFSRIPESVWPYRARLCIRRISSVRKSSNIIDFLYFNKKLTWRTNCLLMVFNAVTHWLQLVGG